MTRLAAGAEVLSRRWKRTSRHGTTEGLSNPVCFLDFYPYRSSEKIMAKPHRGLKKANHGARPANSKARKAKRKHIKT